MTFEEILDQAIAMLQRRGRLTYSTLKRQFQLDDAALDDLKNELIEGQRLAVDERGNVLVWAGDTTPVADPAPASTLVQSQTPLTYTPPHLTAKIFAVRPTLAGERKQVTVLFADLKDSTELIRGLDPEAAQQLLDPAIDSMMAAVHRFEGTVNQVLGDGIMALFGAPIAHEDHALLACYAALAMQAAMRTTTEEIRRTRGLELRIRVGLNSGEVVALVGEAGVGKSRLAYALLEGDLTRERLGQPILLSVQSRTALAWCLSWQGEFPEAALLIQEATHIAEGVGHLGSVVHARQSGGLLYLLKGDLDEAIPRLEDSLATSKATQTPPSPAALSFLAHAYALAGRVAEALPLFAQSLERAAASKFLPCYSLWIGWWGEAALLVGRLDDAMQHATRALEIARAQKEQGYEAYARRLLGSIAVHSRPTDIEPAAAHYRLARDLAEALGMRPLVAHCHRGLGTLYATTGQREQARAQLSAAIDLYRTMEMIFWLPQAEAALAQVERQ
jgi:class 3 adenylate cyclase